MDTTVPCIYFVLYNTLTYFEYSQPHCSSFHIDCSTEIALEGRQQIGPPAEPPQSQTPQWNPTPVEYCRPDNRYVMC